MSSRSMNEKNAGCGRKDDLMTYVYGECTPDEERSFKKHLSECSVCKQEAVEFGAVRKNMHAWEIDSSPRLNLDFAKETGRPLSLREIFSELAAALPGWFKYGAGFAAACSVILLMLAVFNTQIRYDQAGFSFQTALFSNGNAAQPLDPEAVKREAETAARNLVANIIEEKETQIRRDLVMQISELDRQLSEKNTAQLSRVALELKSEQREKLQKALSELELLRKQRQLEDDPFSLWGGIDADYNRKSFQRAVVGRN